MRLLRKNEEEKETERERERERERGRRITPSQSAGSAALLKRLIVGLIVLGRCRCAHLRGHDKSEGSPLVGGAATSVARILGTLILFIAALFLRHDAPGPRTGHRIN